MNKNALVSIGKIALVLIALAASVIGHIGAWIAWDYTFDLVSIFGLVFEILFAVLILVQFALPFFKNFSLRNMKMPAFVNPDGQPVLAIALVIGVIQAFFFDGSSNSVGIAILAYAILALYALGLIKEKFLATGVSAFLVIANVFAFVSILWGMITDSIAAFSVVYLIFILIITMSKVLISIALALNFFSEPNLSETKVF